MAIKFPKQSGSAIVSLLDVDVLTKVVLWPPLTLTLAVTAVYGKWLEYFLSLSMVKASVSGPIVLSL